MIGPLISWCLLLPCRFFLAKFINMCKPRTTSYLLWQVTHRDWHFMEVDQHTYWAGREWWVQADLAPCYQKCYCKWNWSFFKDIFPNRLPFYMGSLPHVIRSLLSHFCLFQNAFLLKVLKLGFLNFKPIFLRVQFSLLATSFSLILVSIFNCLMSF